MERQPETLGRWLRDVAVTIVLLFVGIAVASVVTKGIAPESITVYMVSQLLAWVPVGLWLRHCGVWKFGTRAEFVTYLLLGLAYGIFLDVIPKPWREQAWLGFAAIIVVRPFLQRLVERSPLLAGEKREQPN